MQRSNVLELRQPEPVCAPCATLRWHRRARIRYTYSFALTAHRHRTGLFILLELTAAHQATSGCPQDMSGSLPNICNRQSRSAASGGYRERPPPPLKMARSNCASFSPKGDTPQLALWATSQRLLYCSLKRTLLRKTYAKEASARASPQDISLVHLAIHSLFIRLKAKLRTRWQLDALSGMFFGISGSRAMRRTKPRGTKGTRRYTQK